MIGQRLLHYEIVQKLGEGGMGVVYKAKDTHLDRFVALKLLQPEKLADPARKVRFVQEAKSASALNHPNIITIYDISADDGHDFIAMEHVNGKALDQMIPRGGMRLSEVLKIAIQIAGALARAHAAGIVHRDLKPANIMVDEHGLVKVLDFGLAKLTEQTVSEDDATATIAVNTEEGAIIGTASYMSPEQAEGKRVDARSDIFSFGAVLYEMVTGRRAFQGESRMSTLSAVLRQDAPALSENVPQELQRVITRCLRKDPDRRIQHADDIKVALEDLKEESESGKLSAGAAGLQRGGARRGWWMAGAALAVAVAAGAMWYASRAPGRAVEDVASAPVALTSFPGFERSPTFSPEGDRVAFSWEGNAAEPNVDIYLKLIGSENVQRLTTDPAPDMYPSWSPDGKHIAFSRPTENEYKLMLVPSIGGPERTVAEFPRRVALDATVPITAAWTPDSRWLVIPSREVVSEPFSLFAVSPETRERRRLTPPAAPARGDTFPSVSPDGRTIAFVRVISESAGKLFTVRLNEAMQPDGEPVAVETGLQGGFTSVWAPDGQSIVLGGGLYGFGESRLLRVAAKGGTAVPIVQAGTPATFPAISRDGNRLAFVRPVRDSNIWQVGGLLGGKAEASESRTMNSSFLENFPQYSPDGKRIAFESARSGSREIWVANADGSNLLKLTSIGGPHMGGPRWSPDGRRISYHAEPGGQREIYDVSPDGGASRKLTNHKARDGAQTYSRDGKWLYFCSDRSGSQQVWKMPAEGGEAVQVTKGGGAWAVESMDSKWLYYTKNDPGETSLWKMPAGGGEEVQVIDLLLNASAFEVTARGIYFIPARRPVGVAAVDELRQYDPATGKAKTVLKLPGTTQWGISVSPGGSSLIYSQNDRGGSDLMLLENFK